MTELTEQRIKELWNISKTPYVGTWQSEIRLILYSLLVAIAEKEMAKHNNSDLNDFACHGWSPCEKDIWQLSDWLSAVCARIGIDKKEVDHE